VNQGRVSLKQMAFFGCVAALFANPKVVLAQDQEFTLGMTFDSAKKLVEGRGTRLMGLAPWRGCLQLVNPEETKGPFSFVKGGCS
jgi:hypothetical protein